MVNSTIYILLPVRNRARITANFIRCLTRQTYRSWHLVLIDDGSDDNTVPLAKKQIEDLTVLQGNGTWWWAGSLQAGYRWLKKRSLPQTDIVLITNDDTEFDDSYLETAVDLVKNNKKCLLLSECHDKHSGAYNTDCLKVNWAKLEFIKVANDHEDIECLSTKGLFLKMEDFYKLGGFHPRLLPHYLSDYEFTLRAYRRKFKLKSHSSVKLISDENTTGIHRFEKNDSPATVIRKIFSKKSAINPIYWTTFILLTCPNKWKALNIARVWKASLIYIYRRQM